jgi:hypothetical protein
VGGTGSAGNGGTAGSSPQPDAQDWAAWPMPNSAVDVQAGAPNPASYKDNGNGTVTDNVTGLMWQQAVPLDVYTWMDALSYCSNLQLAGYDDAAVSSAVATAAPAPRALITGAVDLLCIGGLSLAISVWLLAFGKVPFEQKVPALVPYVLTVAITWPHFLSANAFSTRRAKACSLYRKASLYFPIALAAYGIFALSRTSETAV